MVLFIFNLYESVSILVGVVFITLIERKVLGLIQFRLGPNKIFFKGVFQALSDALKLMSKSSFIIFFSSLFEYNFMPVGMLLIMLALWGLVPNGLYSYNNTLLIILCILSVGVYPIMYGAWFSGSFYSMLGAIRSIAQMISYEVSMIMIVLSLIFFPKTFNFVVFGGGAYSGVFCLFFLLMCMLFISFLVELGRTPVDLLEGESELVSGFNTEYFGLKFALIFLAEYGMIMFMSGVMSSLGVGLFYFSVIWGGVTMLFMLLIVLIRGILPRLRYDKLMFLCWVSMLSLSLGILTANMGVICIL